MVQWGQLPLLLRVLCWYPVQAVAHIRVHQACVVGMHHIWVHHSVSESEGDVPSVKWLLWALMHLGVPVLCTTISLPLVLLIPLVLSSNSRYCLLIWCSMWVWYYQSSFECIGLDTFGQAVEETRLPLVAQLAIHNSMDSPALLCQVD